MDLNSIIRKRGVQVGAAAAVLLSVAISLAVMSASPTSNGGAPEPLVAGNQVGDAGLVSASNTPGTDEARDAAEIDAETTGDSSSGPPSSGTGASGSAEGQQDASDATPSMKRVRIMWWNDTQDKRVDGSLLQIGTSSWSPDESAASDVGAISVQVDKPTTLVIYPDGPGGSRIEVPILFQKMMKDDSEQDAIIVEVSDTGVRVLGNPVENVDQTFDRF